jgi:hypothetical protein
MTKPVDPAAFSEGVPHPYADLAGAPADPVPAAAPADAAASDIPFTPVDLQPRPNGWTAYRQRAFIEALAETGSVRAAADEAGACVRSAYRLRTRKDGRSFAAAWDQAQILGTRRLIDIAFERATTGHRRGVWKDGKQVGTEYVPSDRLLMFLLSHFNAVQFGKLSGLQPVAVMDEVQTAERHLTQEIARLADAPLPADPDRYEDFETLWDEPGAYGEASMAHLREKLARRDAAERARR